MMLAFGHAISGWCAWMMLVNALSLFHQFILAAMLLLAILGALAMAGAAIICDWDHPNSTITTAFGPFSYQVHLAVIELHYTVASATADAGNRKLPGPHRGITHWWPFPLATGAVVAVGAWLNQWVMFAILLILFTGAIRALTVPEYRPRLNDTIRHRWSMLSAHGILDLAPVTIMGLATVGVLGMIFVSEWVLYLCILIAAMLIPFHVLKKLRKYVNRTYRIGGYWLYYLIPVGKIGTVILAAAIALVAIRVPYVVENGYWLGALVTIGMYLHILGDAPTEMGIPGWKLNRYWRLPKWLAFKAGGPFEILGCWVPMVGLGIYLIPGLRPREEVLMVQTYILYGLCALAALAICIEFGTRYARKRAWI
jgi:hypothetical protein